MSKGILYLIPVGMGNNNAAKIVPAYNLEIISSLKHFIVENGKTARAFIKDVIPGVVLQELHYYELNQHTKEMDVHSLINPLLKR
jgi:16S rRNA (cytidine1402-2'-O)-methyltransferase